jgi:hypothetical protein
MVPIIAKAQKVNMPIDVVRSLIVNPVWLLSIWRCLSTEYFSRDEIRLESGNTNPESKANFAPPDSNV